MKNNGVDDEITFDSNSGISEEEQREILEKINGIAEKNRRSLSSGAEADAGKKKKKSRRFKAKKSGSLFLALVNAAAITILAAGLITLYALHGKKDAQVREGTKLYNSAERALIEEIRRETSFRIEEKEKEINIISSLLEEISAELRELYSGSRKLSPDEQKAAENRLKSLQEDYLAMMGHLQDERSRILEESRARETEVQTQIENRTRQSTPGAARGTVDAAHEMDRLSGEQRQSAAVEAQMVAFFSNLNGQIAENKFDEAAGTVQAMKDFLNTPAFQTLRSMRERKDIYAQAINSFEAMIHEARPGKQDITAGPPPQNDPNIEKMLADLEEKNAMLEQDLAGKNRTIAALNSGSSGSARLIAEKDRQITALNSGNNNLNRTIAEKDRQIAVLNSGNDNLNRTIAEKDRQITALNSGNADLNRTVKTQGDSLDKIKGIVWDKDLDDMSFNEIRDSVAQIQRALESLQ